jgi:hypothetical protein
MKSRNTLPKEEAYTKVKDMNECERYQLKYIKEHVWPEIPNDFRVEGIGGESGVFPDTRITVGCLTKNGTWARNSKLVKCYINYEHYVNETRKYKRLDELIERSLKSSEIPHFDEKQRVCPSCGEGLLKEVSCSLHIEQVVCSTCNHQWTEPIFGDK